ncbi:MAG TPA: hypothetical protein PLF35_14065 [Prolixibacteraceae bacterium]|nr:hypothetical protein [Prolixibacteraceae bacterium]
MKQYRRNIVFIVVGIVLYLLWSNGGEPVYGKIVKTGVEKFTTKVSKIESVRLEYMKEENKTMLFFKYPDRTTKIALEYCLPIVLLLAWHLSLYFDRRISAKVASKLFLYNFLIVYFIQLMFPLLLYNISQSKMKSMGLFIGLQVFGFLVFFLILKDSFIIKYKYGQLVNEPN